MRYHSIFLLAIAATTAFAQAQTGPQPDGKRLRLSTDSLEIYMVRMGHSQRTGVLVDQLDTVRVNGETLLRRIYRTKDAALGTTEDTLVDTYANLQPRTVRARSERGTERLDWQSSRVTGVVEETDKPSRTIDSPVPTVPAWYSSTSFDLILRASPLAAGYEVAVPSFSGRQGSSVLRAKVTDSETVEGQGDTWRVDADFAGLSVTFWISKTTRRLVKQVMHIAPGTEILFVATRGPST